MAVNIFRDPLAGTGGNVLGQGLANAGQIFGGFLQKSKDRDFRQQMADADAALKRELQQAGFDADKELAGIRGQTQKDIFNAAADNRRKDFQLELKRQRLEQNYQNALRVGDVDSAVKAFDALNELAGISGESDGEAPAGVASLPPAVGSPFALEGLPEGIPPLARRDPTVTSDPRLLMGLRSSQPRDPVREMVEALIEEKQSARNKTSAADAFAAAKNFSDPSSIDYLMELAGIEGEGARNALEQIIRENSLDVNAGRASDLFSLGMGTQQSHPGLSQRALSETFNLMGVGEGGKPSATQAPVSQAESVAPSGGADLAMSVASVIENIDSMGFFEIQKLYPKIAALSVDDPLAASELLAALNGAVNEKFSTKRVEAPRPANPNPDISR